MRSGSPRLGVVIALLAACLAGASSAQVLYKSTGKDGKVVYSDKPSPDAVKVEEIQPPQEVPVDSRRTASDKAKLDKQGREADQRGREREQAWKDAQAEFDNAQVALKTAQERRVAGLELVEGDVLASVKGTRNSPAYTERQEALERAVTEAQLRVDRARAKLNQLR
jgi:hypothetical protein